MPRDRTGLVPLLPWLLCGCALALVGVSVVLQVAGRDVSRATDEELTALVLEAGGFVAFALVGAVIAARLPENPYGWVWCGFGLSYGVLVVFAALDRVGIASGWAVDALAYLGYLGLVGSLVPIFLLFPTGRVPSPAWRWLSRATVVVGAGLVLLTPFAASVIAPGTSPPWSPGGAAAQFLADVATGGAVAMFAFVLLAMASVVPRYRRAGKVERTQLEWFALAAVVNAGFFLADLLLGLSDRGGIWDFVQVATFTLIPVAVGIAVLKYRLYEIDRLVSRTVSYGVLTGGLVLLYLLLVALLRPLLEPLTGSSSLAVAGSTLAVAAVFNPARRRLQTAVDRRFDRARYDAARAVQAFAARLRTQVDLDEVTAGLRDTVVATVAPTRVAVWLRVASGMEGR